MAKKPQTVEEILAACRQQDGGGSSDPTPAADSAPAPDAAPAPESTQSEGPAPGTPTTGPVVAADRSKMSVADMLAAARGEKSKTAAAPKAEPPPAAAETESAPVGDVQAADRSKMSVADMLAAARGEKSKPKAAPKAAAKPAPAPKAAAKATPKAAPAAAAPSGPKDTASILAAARKQDKPGPISKAEAKALGREVAPAVKQQKQAPAMPAKPGYAQPRPAASSQPQRRTFLAGLAAVTVGSGMAVGFASLAVTHLLWVLGLARFMFPNILTEPPTKFKVGFPDDYAGGQVQAKFKAQFGVWIVRDQYEGEPQLYALKSVCTHLGCTPNWLEGEQKFKCPCHGSGFYKDGVNFEGPAPRPLERYAIRIADDGQLEVDKSRTFQEELGQWADPACFVSV